MCTGLVPTGAAAIRLSPRRADRPINWFHQGSHHVATLDHVLPEYVAATPVSWEPARTRAEAAEHSPVPPSTFSRAGEASGGQQQGTKKPGTRPGQLLRWKLCPRSSPFYGMMPRSLAQAPATRSAKSSARPRSSCP